MILEIQTTEGTKQFYYLKYDQTPVASMADKSKKVEFVKLLDNVSRVISKYRETLCILKDGQVGFIDSIGSAV